MKRHVLFCITSNPLEGAQASEAIRIAAGIAPWNKIEVSVYLHTPILEALSLHQDRIQGMEPIQRFLPLLSRESNGLLAPDFWREDLELDGEQLPLFRLSPQDWKTHREKSTWLLHF